MHRVLTAVLLLAAFPVAAAAAQANSPDHTLSDSTVVISQGGVALTVKDVDVYASSLPADKVGPIFNSPQRIETILRNLVLTKELAAASRKDGLQNREDVRAAIAAATDQALATAKVNAVQREAEKRVPDMQELAHERYLADPEKYAIPKSIDVKHILIATKDRSDKAANALAQKLYKELKADPSQFDADVAKYSDDLSKKGNDGLIPDATSNRLVPSFREAAGKLTRVGEIAGPVKSPYGYHIIKAVKITPATSRSYDEVKGQLIAKLRKEWIAKKVQDYVDGLRSGKVNANPEVIQALRTRYGDSLGEN